MAGVQAGVGFSTISPPNTDQAVSMSLGLHIGVYAIVPFLKTISIQTEFVYAQKYIGLVIGAGVPIGKLAVEGRYDGGFRKIEAAAGAAIQRNRSFSFLVRMHF